MSVKEETISTLSEMMNLDPMTLRIFLNNSNHEFEYHFSTLLEVTKIQEKYLEITSDIQLLNEFGEFTPDLIFKYLKAKLTEELILGVKDPKFVISTYKYIVDNFGQLGLDYVNNYTILLKWQYTILQARKQSIIVEKGLILCVCTCNCTTVIKRHKYEHPIPYCVSCYLNCEGI